MKQKSPTEKAVALKYDQNTDKAPCVVAKGSGFIAQQIKEMAASYGIPLYQDSDLTEALSQVELDRHIPAQLYGAVAYVLSWIYKANQSLS